MPEKSEFLTMAEILERLKKQYHKELGKVNIDSSYYPIRLTVWRADENFIPVRKLVEVDERELGGAGSGNRSD